jgi:hypothetical protein
VSHVIACLAQRFGHEFADERIILDEVRSLLAYIRQHLFPHADGSVASSFLMDARATSTFGGLFRLAEPDPSRPSAPGVAPGEQTGPEDRPREMTFYRPSSSITVTRQSGVRSALSSAETCLRAAATGNRSRTIVEGNDVLRPCRACHTFVRQ